MISEFKFFLQIAKKKLIAVKWLIYLKDFFIDYRRLYSLSTNFLRIILQIVSLVCQFLLQLNIAFSCNLKPLGISQKEFVVIHFKVYGPGQYTTEKIVLVKLWKTHTAKKYTKNYTARTATPDIYFGSFTLSKIYLSS